MPELNFQPVDEPATDNPDYDDTGCQCPPGDTQYLLEIEEGQAVLIHAACGKQPPASWGDWHEFVTMDGPIPVTVEWEPKNCTSCRSLYEDCDHWVQVTATSVPEDVRAEALALSHQHAATRNAQ